MREKVVQAYLNLSYVEKVLAYHENSTDFFLIVTNQDMDDLSYRLTCIQTELMDTLTDYYFEIRYVIKDNFTNDCIPSNATTHASR